MSVVVGNEHADASAEFAFFRICIRDIVEVRFSIMQQQDNVFSITLVARHLSKQPEDLLSCGSTLPPLV